MKINYTEIKGIYSVKIKIFEPECEINGFVVGVHGFGGDMESSVISALAERMSKHGIAVVAFNFAGHGTSEADRYFNVSNCRMDLQEVFDFAQHRYKKAQIKAVFATSFGGYIILSSLESLPDETKIVLRAPAVNMAEVFERVVSEVIPVEEYIRKGSVTLGFERKIDVSADFYRELKANNILEKKTERPMLVIHGDCDELVFLKDIESFFEKNSQAQLNIIKGADHRFKKEGELTQILDFAEEYIIG